MRGWLAGSVLGCWAGWLWWRTNVCLVACRLAGLLGGKRLEADKLAAWPDQSPTPTQAHSPTIIPNRLVVHRWSHHPPNAAFPPPLDVPPICVAKPPCTYANAMSRHYAVASMHPPRGPMFNTLPFPLSATAKAAHLRTQRHYTNARPPPPQDASNTWDRAR